MDGWREIKERRELAKDKEEERKKRKLAFFGIKLWMMGKREAMTGSSKNDVFCLFALSRPQETEKINSSRLYKKREEEDAPLNNFRRRRLLKNRMVKGEKLKN